MLTSIKLDQDIYVEANERTYELVADGYIPPDDIEKRIKRIKKSDTVPVHIHGETKTLLKIPLQDAMRIFGEHIIIMQKVKAFDGEKIYVNQGDEEPIHIDNPVLPPPSEFVIQPNSTILVPTGYSDGDTAKVYFEGNSESISVEWQIDSDKECFHPDAENISAGTHDYIIQGERSSIRISNRGLQPVRFKLAFTRYEQ
jgi:hypothetical protein